MVPWRTGPTIVEAVNGGWVVSWLEEAVSLLQIPPFPLPATSNLRLWYTLNWPRARRQFIWARPSLNWREMWRPASSVNILMHRLKTVSYVEHDKCKHNIFWKIYLLLLVNMVGKLWFYSSNIDWRAAVTSEDGFRLSCLISIFWSNLGKREKTVQITAVWDDKYWVSIYSAILGHDFYFYIEAILSFITNYNKRWQKEKGKENCTISYIWGNAECQFTQPFCHIIPIFTLEQYNNS